MSRNRIRSASGLLILLLVTLLTACGSGQAPAPAGPRPLTTQEAERLAVIRFKAFDAGTRSINGVLTDGRTQIGLSGWVNYTDHVGYALGSPNTPGGTDSAPESPFLVQWSPEQVARQLFPGSTPPMPVPTTGWEVGALSAGNSYLSAGLLILISLSSDRPENPQLLAQSTATWIRQDTVDETTVDVMTGPAAANGTSGAALRYWVDGTGVLLRLEIQFPGAPWSVITFKDAPEVTIPTFGATG